MDWESQDDGYVAALLVEDGAKDLAVGSPVLVFVEDQARPGTAETLLASDSWTQVADAGAALHLCECGVLLDLDVFPLRTLTGRLRGEFAAHCCHNMATP